MKTIKLDKDIQVMYVTATSFPDGIQEAFEKLHLTVPVSANRRVFGISRPEGGNGIVYRAAVEEIEDGEAKEYGLQTLILKKGNYVSTTIHNFSDDVESIGRTFRQMLDEPNIDPQGYCVEIYSNNDVECIVRLEQ